MVGCRSTRRRAMNLRAGMALALCLAFLSGPKVWAAAACPGENLQTLLHDSWSERYLDIDATDLERSRELFERILAGDSSPSAQRPAAQALGLELLSACDVPTAQTFWVLREASGRKQGRGFYVFAQHRQAGRVLQVPHRRSDAQTEAIGLQMFLRGGWRAIAFNSASRTAGPGQTSSPSDLARLRVSTFQAFTEAVARVHDGTALLQLHGFSRNKRKTFRGMHASMVVSGGSRRVTPVVQAAHACLRETFGARVLLFPRDIQELGATANSNAALFRRLQQDGFIHLELDRAVRRSLAANVQALDSLNRCFTSLRVGEPR